MSWHAEKNFEEINKVILEKIRGSALLQNNIVEKNLRPKEKIKIIAGDLIGVNGLILQQEYLQQAA